MHLSTFYQTHFIRLKTDLKNSETHRIILHDNTLNLPVVAQQPHPDPNYAPHAAARLLAVA